MEHKAHNDITMNTKYSSALRNSLCTLWVIVFFVAPKSYAQTRIDSFLIHGDIKVTIDHAATHFKKNTVIFFALPNGNSTEWTMGKKLNAGDDWHWDIQHIRAQTKFLRNTVNDENITVIYLENKYKSWPSWKQKHAEFNELIPHLVDSLSSLICKKHLSVYLNGHSGGGSFIFGYLAGVTEIPSKIKRISFLDSNYGYDSSYYPKFKNWLLKNRDAALNVFAYNDSIALYNGKPFVSATGGTWWRGHHMLEHFGKDFSFIHSATDSLDIYKSKDQRIQFYFKINLDRGIYHTQQVELNGFIHSVLCGTKWDSKGYEYYTKRAYGDLIE